MPVDLRVEIIDGLAGALEALDWPALIGEPLAVRRGFPRLEALDLPCISIHGGTGRLSSCYPEILSVGEPDGAGDVATVARVGRYMIPLQVDLWTVSKTQRLSITPHFLALFTARLEPGEGGALDAIPAGLRLDLEGAAGAPCQVRLTTDDDDDDEEAQRGLYRRRWPLEARADVWELYSPTAASYNAQTTVIDP